MSRLNQARSALLCGAITMAPSFATATPIVIPPGLTLGSTYFLAFVTDDRIGAASPDISTYDAFVTAEADSDAALAGLATSWKVIGSTETVDAVTHIDVTGPVYRLDGVQIATGSADLFDGAIAAPLDLDQHGNPYPTFPETWTGTQCIGGTKDPGFALGDAGVDSGAILATNCTWLQGPPRDTTITKDALYGISGPLVVPAAAPEPATLTLTTLGLAGVVSRYRRRVSR